MVDTYDQGTELLPQLLALVRARKRTADQAGRAADAAIRLNAAAAGELTDAVRVLRELVAALTNGAGHDGKHPLSEATQVAWALLHSDTPELPEAP
jgi:hypothetical protein